MAVPGNPTPVLVVGPGAETFTSQVVASSGGETKVVIDGKSVKFLSFPVMVKGWDSMVEGCAGAVIASTPDAKEASIAEWRAVVEAKISGPVEYIDEFDDDQALLSLLRRILFPPLEPTDLPISPVQPPVHEVLDTTNEDSKNSYQDDDSMFNFLDTWQFWIALIGVFVAVIGYRIWDSYYDNWEYEVGSEPYEIVSLLQAWHRKGISIPMSYIMMLQWQNDSNFLPELFDWGKPAIFYDHPAEQWEAMSGSRDDRWSANMLSKRIEVIENVRRQSKSSFVYYSRSSKLYPMDPAKEKNPPHYWKAVEQMPRVNMSGSDFFKSAGCHLDEDQFSPELSRKFLGEPLETHATASVQACQTLCLDHIGCQGLTITGSSCSLYSSDSLGTLTDDKLSDSYVRLPEDHAPRLYYSSELKDWEKYEMFSGVGPIQDFYGEKNTSHLVEGEGSYHVWIGGPGVKAQIHYDASHNFYVQLAGRKRAVLFPPSTHEAWQLYPRLHPHHRQSQVDFDSPDISSRNIFKKFFFSQGATKTAPIPQEGESQPIRTPDGEFGSTPRERRLKDQGVHGMVAILYPGDVLYIPPFWLHHMTSLGASPDHIQEGDDCRTNVSISINMWKDSSWLTYFKKAISLPIPMRQSFSVPHKWIVTSLYVLIFLHSSALMLETDVSEVIPQNSTLVGVREALIPHILSTRYIAFPKIPDPPILTVTSPADPKLDQNRPRWEKVRTFACSLRPGMKAVRGEALLQHDLLTDPDGFGSVNENLAKFAKDLSQTARSAAYLLRHIKPPWPVKASDINFGSAEPKTEEYVAHGVRYTMTIDYIEEFLKASLGTDNVHPFMSHFSDTINCGI